MTLPENDTPAPIMAMPVKREKPVRDNHLASALGFAASQAIESGLLDDYLDRLASDVRWRKALINPPKVPRKTAEMRLSGHQVWAWINDEVRTSFDQPQGRGQWEVRGTGVVLDDTDLAEIAQRKKIIAERGHFCGDYPAPCNCDR